MAENNALWNWGNQQTYHEKIKQEIEKASMGGVDIDDTLSTESTNPIQNKAVAEALQNVDADTLDGVHAISFFREIGQISSGSIKDYALALEGSGAVFVNKGVTDVPFDSYWFVTINKCNTNHILVDATQISTNKKYIMTYNAGTTSWSGWTLVNPMSETDKTKLDNTNLAYGTCATAAATAAKVVTITGNTNWKLAVGSEIVVKFTNANTASNCTLNVNGTGAKQIWYHNTVYTGASTMVTGAANVYVRYIYDGTYWVWMGWSADSNTWTAASTSANGYVSTGAQTFAGAKTFNGVVKVAGATDASVSQVRNIAAGTAAATTTNCPNGALYGQYT